MNTEKLTINAAGEKLLLGSDYIQLKDESQQALHTDDLPTFLEFAESQANYDEHGNPADGYAITFNEDEATLHSGWKTSARENRNLATCKFKESPYLSLLSNVNGKNISLKALSDLMKALREFSGTNEHDLLSNLSDFKVNKVLKINRMKGPNGDLAFSVVRESAGVNDFIPPNTLKFNVPVIDGLTDTVVFEFDFSFDFEQVQDQVELQFKLQNWSLPIRIAQAKKMVILSYMTKVKDIPAFWGRRDIKLATNEWAYKTNGIRL